MGCLENRVKHSLTPNTAKLKQRSQLVLGQGDRVRYSLGCEHTHSRIRALNKVPGPCVQKFSVSQKWGQTPKFSVSQKWYQTCEHTTIFVPGRGEKYSATKCGQALRDFWFSFEQGFSLGNVHFFSLQNQLIWTRRISFRLFHYDMHTAVVTKR